MSLSDNINNAFEVVLKTYENIDKLMRYCDTISSEFNYIPISDKDFLRYKSDRDYNGWLVNSFIKLYQYQKDQELENGWKDGPIFGLNIYLIGEPSIYLAKYEFDDIHDWGSSYSVSDHWMFFRPIHAEKYGHDFEITELENHHSYFISEPAPYLKKNYKNLNRVLFTKKDLIQLTAENVGDMVFKEFDKLRAEVHGSL
ncbi:hypothetical protein [Natranaerobius thermophilus]|uniref:Uncharacterized protein n=1 Tax=Natranaerobius thermophilus (strain ATCC BAA-1301 / DSM 18059 / JW/NM-WN-LF) TaxID=457570 RepID=B2A1E2_NATTJ|nr:hypothetical protein [Natranaerobius thermophilus]ACB86080.1 hypothetical protein Nther_2519 [Natranaerobius thermophilus JW/NM-WN-LF]